MLFGLVPTNWISECLSLFPIDKSSNKDIMPYSLIAGYGYIAEALAEELISRGHEVVAIKRRATSLSSGVKLFTADLSLPNSLLDLPAHFDFVFYTASADSSSKEDYRKAYVDGARNLLAALSLKGANPKRVFFTSSTSVYGQTDGSFVDEESETKPLSDTGKVMLEAERVFTESSFAATILRLGGIYGPGRSRLIEAAQSGKSSFAKSKVFTNRIHRDDIAAALSFLMEMENPDPLYLGVDNHPCASAEVIKWIAGELEIECSTAEATPSSQPTQMRANKRCKNDKLIKAGYSFLYPSFREGYSALLP